MPSPSLIVKPAWQPKPPTHPPWFNDCIIPCVSDLIAGVTGPQFPAHHLTMAGEYGMCLLGLKPCVLIDHGNWDEAQYGEETYAKMHNDAVVRGGSEWPILAGHWSMSREMG